jgi:hypothetical protein
MENEFKKIVYHLIKDLPKVEQEKLLEIFDKAQSNILDLENERKKPKG